MFKSYYFNSLLNIKKFSKTILIILIQISLKLNGALFEIYLNFLFFDLSTSSSVKIGPKYN
jgi:hypothetical protein